MTREIALHCMKSYSELHSDLCELCSIYGETGCDHCFEDALQYVIGMLEQEPKTGHWIYVGEENKEETKAGNFRYVCSECGFTDVHGKSIYVPYCWQCGAKMAESEGKE